MICGADVFYTMKKDNEKNLREAIKAQLYIGPRGKYSSPAGSPVGQKSKFPIISPLILYKIANFMYFRENRLTICSKSTENPLGAK